MSLKESRQISKYNAAVFEPKLLEFVACPACHSPLTQPDDCELLCIACGRKYPVRDGIPVLIVEQAQK